jgi:uncharacterized membrane protein (DUF4010 family)
MDQTDILLRLGLALAIGLLIGLERGWHGRQESEGDRIAGIRTFALTALLGSVCGWLSGLATPLVPAAAFVALGALLSVSYWVGSRENKDFGLTTEVALLLTFALGVAVMLGEMAPAAAVAVVMTVLLSLKATLHHWIEHMEKLELDALLKLALISVVILPLLPDRGYGPGGVLNPYELWWAVVVVAGLSFAGYLAIRLAGPDAGVLATGVFGGLASSTATTLALARLAGQRSVPDSAAAAGILTAGAVASLRVLALVAVFQPGLVMALVVPLTGMAVLGLAGAALVWRLTGRPDGQIGRIEGVANPVQLGSAVAFGAVLAVVLVGVHYLNRWLGTGGVYVAAALSGVTDMDALTISVSRLVGEGLPIGVGALAIFIAVSVNTLVKGGISLVAGGPRLGGRVIAVNALLIVAGGALLWLRSPA